MAWNFNWRLGFGKKTEDNTAPAIVETVEIEVAEPQPPAAPIVTEPKHRWLPGPGPSAMYGADYMAAGTSTPIISLIYNGEKNFGEMGPVIRNVLDHDRLGRRAWDSYLKSETIFTVTRQITRLKVGKGLTLDAEPKRKVLEMFGIKMTDEQLEEFNEKVESLWNLYATTQGAADYSNRSTLGKIAARADRNVALRGDVLVVLRVDDSGFVKVQLIDGEHVTTPQGLGVITNNAKLVDNFVGYDYVWKDTNNRIRSGVEINEKGEHVAYHVRTGIGMDWERIPARNRFGDLVAYLYYGEEFRLDNSRGIPRITSNMESSKQLEDYTSATVSSAVERARLPYFIEHEVNASGIDPRMDDILKVVGGSRESLDMPTDVNGEELARTIAVSTQKQTFNMAPGSKISAVDSKAEIRYKEFFETRENAIAATNGLPPEVARQVFTSSYSASRGAMNLLGFSLDIDRDDMGHQFYQPIYNLQLSMWVLSLKIDAPGYIDALRSGNKIILNAYRHANWEGTPLPEIDELNAFKAARLALGTGFEHIPLSTVQKVMKKLGTGNYAAAIVQAAKELHEAEEKGIKPAAPNITPPPDDEDDKKNGKDGEKEDKEETDAE